jgi:Cu/Ag efflux pump CusA
MLIYLDHAWEAVKAKCRAAGREPGVADLYEAVMEGAVERVRPKMMTVVAIMAGLLPIMWGYRDRLGSDEPDRGTNGRRHGFVDSADAGGDSGNLRAG